VLSNETPGKESPKELIPRLNNSMVLGDKWELTFDNAASVAAIQKALKAGRKVSLAGMQASPGQVEFLAANRIRLNAAQVIGVFDAPTPKMPNP
jgi:hypothetical protein